MVIAFWNINNNTDLGSTLINFVKEQSVDILMLAESNKNLKGKRGSVVDDIILDFVTRSKKDLDGKYSLIPDGDFRVKVLTAYNLDHISSMRKNIKSSRWSGLFIDLPGIIKFNLFPVHFYSKVNWSESSLALECSNFSRDIYSIEQITGCTNSILMGDFNMNPFENGVVASNGINALQDLNYLKDHPNGREIDGTFYKYFYNPMWNFFGDHDIPYGTLYHRTSGHVSHEWNLYDQVMLRPELYNHIDRNSVKIISKISGESLTKAYGRPEEAYSDHLPITLTLNL